MAKERKIRRKKPASKSGKQTFAQEQRKIERLLGEEFDSLAQARKALKQESKPISEKTYKPAKVPERFNINKADRYDKSLYAKKIGTTAYTRRLNEWWDEHPDEDPNDNPYCYHDKK